MQRYVKSFTETIGEDIDCALLTLLLRMKLQGSWDTALDSKAETSLAVIAVHGNVGVVSKASMCLRGVTIVGWRHLSLQQQQQISL